MFQRFTAIVNNMKANVEDFPYTEHDQALKLLHVLDQMFGVLRLRPSRSLGNI
jgi:hypothetical protein